MKVRFSNLFLKPLKTIKNHGLEKENAVCIKFNSAQTFLSKFSTIIAG